MKKQLLAWMAGLGAVLSATAARADFAVTGNFGAAEHYSSLGAYSGENLFQSNDGYFSIAINNPPRAWKTGNTKTPVADFYATENPQKLGDILNSDYSPASVQFVLAAHSGVAGSFANAISAGRSNMYLPIISYHMQAESIRLVSDSAKQDPVPNPGVGSIALLGVAGYLIVSGRHRLKS